MAERWRKLKRFVIFRILHADDSPRRIALGVALGLFVAMTPTVGLQMVIALSLATLLRINKAASVAMVWVTNPVTMVAIYYQNWVIGRYFVQTSTINAEAHIQKISQSIGGFSNFMAHLLDWPFWKQVLSLIGALGIELWVGSFVAAVACAIPGYFLSLWAITAYRQKYPRPRFFKRSARAAAAAGRSLAASRPKLRKNTVV